MAVLIQEHSKSPTDDFIKRLDSLSERCFTTANVAEAIVMGDILVTELATGTTRKLISTDVDASLIFLKGLATEDAEANVDLRVLSHDGVVVEDGLQSAGLDALVIDVLLSTNGIVVASAMSQHQY